MVFPDEEGPRSTRCWIPFGDLPCDLCQVALHCLGDKYDLVGMPSFDGIVQRTNIVNTQAFSQSPYRRKAPAVWGSPPSAPGQLGSGGAENAG